MPCHVNVWCGGRVEAVPGQLLGQEPVDAGAAMICGSWPV